MKYLIWIPLALLTGLILGGWGPRQDLKLARQELELARTSGGRTREDPIRAVTDIVRIPVRSTERSGRIPPPEPVADLSGTEPVEAPPVPMDGPVPEPPPETAETLRERIDAAMEIWRIRSDIARDTLLARARFDDRATDQFDLLMAAMNLRLRTEIGKIADQLRTGEIPNQEFSIRSAHVLAGAIATTYDEMDRTLPPSWRVGEERSVDLTDFIDPSVAEPLIAVESRLSIQGRRPGRNRRTP